MVIIQSGVDVGAGADSGEGFLDVEEDNIPSASARFVTPRTERFGGRRVNGTHIQQALVRCIHLPLSTPIERTARTAVRRLLVQRLVYRLSDVAWAAITSHLLFVPAMPASIRLQAARTLDDMLAIVPGHLMAAPSDLQATVQRRVLDDVLAQ
jgi:hypothetical protein